MFLNGGYHIAMQPFPCTLLSLQATTIVNNTRNRDKNSVVSVDRQCALLTMHCARRVTFKMMFAHSIMSSYMIDVLGKQGIPGPE